MLIKWSIVFGIIVLYLLVEYLAKAVRQLKHILHSRFSRGDSQKEADTYR